MSAPVAIATSQDRLSALASLMLRAGASDTDREAWLAQRKLGVTGTEIRDLHIGAKTRAQLIAEKLGRKTNAFAGNIYTRWGNEREPVIADLILWKFGISPETRLFRAVDNPRFLVSPDGLGEAIDGELLGSEIKTAGMDVSTTSAAFEKKGYLYQCVWAMVVTGARRWLYAWESRDGDMEGGFEAGEVHFEWIVWDDMIEILAAQLVVEAEEFLAALDAAAAEAYVEPDVDDQVDTHAVNYLRFISLEKEAAAAKVAEYDAILATVGEREQFQQEGESARVTLTPMKLGTRLERDEESTKVLFPELWAAFVQARDAWEEALDQNAEEVPTETKPRLTITAIKKGKS